MNCDIIIPAFNSGSVLADTLAAIAEQQYSSGHAVRVLLTDDGSTDDTREIAQQYFASDAFEMIILSGPHGGAAKARNRALDAVVGDLILFSQADIRLRPGALNAHFLWHEENTDITAAALGWIGWDPALRPTPLMEWMVHGGPQNNYDALLGQLRVDSRHFFNGAHVSLKSEFLGSERFATSFRRYGWEDLELGRRLHQRGLSLYFLERAQALHHHFYDANAVRVRQEQAGRSLLEYQRLHPEVRLVPDRGPAHRYLFRLFLWSGAFAVLRLVHQWQASRGVAPRLFSLMTTLDLWTGIYSSKR